jgi:outer membrane protein OmpA-like peptidoglycan-associated protein/tetratricopeptide (TPR) repeat protein
MKKTFLTFIAIACSAVLLGQTVDSTAAGNNTVTPPATGESPAVGTNTVAPPAPEESAPVASADSEAPPVVAPAHKGSRYASALRKANVLYNQKAFSEAIPYYEKAREFDNTNKQILANLGDCYRMTNNTTGMIHCYGELVRSGNADPIHELYYGQALMENGEMETAKPFFEKYSTDERGKELASSVTKKRSYSKDADAYSVELANYNSLQNDLCAVKFNDGIVFASTRQKTDWIKRSQGWTDGNFSRLYYTERKESGKDAAPKIFMGDLNSKFNDGPVCFTKDYNKVYFTRNNSKKADMAEDGTFKLKVYEAALDQNGFNSIVSLPFNNNNYNSAHPSISYDGSVLYFSSDMPGGKGGMDIYMCRRDSAGNWGEPVNVGTPVNTAGNEIFPFVSANNVLYFSSNGHDGLGGLDVYEAKMIGGKPSKIFNMGEPVNTKDDDFGIFLNEDCKSGFISSNRKSGGLDDDIYDLKILRDVKRGKEVKLLIKDKISGEPVPEAKIVINGDTVLADFKGEYVSSAEEEMEYKIVAVKADYFPAEDTYSAASSPEDSFTREILIEKDPKVYLRGLITDAKSGQLLENVSITVVDIESNTEIDKYETTASGDYFKFLTGKHIGDRVTYLIRLSKPGYLDRSVVFTESIEKEGEMNLNDKLNLTLGKVEVGMDLAKMIDLKPIYFDLGKSTIRKDAAIELDKIVQIMNEYPNMYIELGSHTDCRSGAASNLKLSTARAKASATYIVKKGINKARITGKGYGESKLLNNCACEGKVQSTCSEQEHEVNRRTEFIITKLK